MRISKKKQVRKVGAAKSAGTTKSHELQLLEGLEQSISLSLDHFLVLSEEGDPTQIAFALQQAKNEFLKRGPEMHHIAGKIGGDLPALTADFLESVDALLYGPGMLSEDLISHCLDSKARLKATCS